jgi:hypothetical protein
VDALQSFADAVSLDPSYTVARGNRDRIRVVVDREVADEVARILAERAGGGERPDGRASLDPAAAAATPDAATP